MLNTSILTPSIVQDVSFPSNLPFHQPPPSKRPKELLFKKQEDEEIHRVMEMFYSTINPTINFGHRGHRKAIKDLVKFLGGVDKVLKATQFAISIQGQSFAPVITTPSDLKEKLTKLRLYYHRQKQGDPKQRTNKRYGDTSS